MLLTVGCMPGFAVQADRWQLETPGMGIVWRVDSASLPHHDHIEMSGRQVSVVLRYGVNRDGSFVLNKGMVWPLLRTVPNNTHASLMRRLGWDPLREVVVNGWPLTGEKVERIALNGQLTVNSLMRTAGNQLVKVERVYFPAADQPALVECYRLVHTGSGVLQVEVPAVNMVVRTDAKRGTEGSYRIVMTTSGAGAYRLNPGDTCRFEAVVAAYKANQTDGVLQAAVEQPKRRALVRGWMDNLVLETPDPVIDRMFAFSKIRACESIYETKGGPMHGPGGESFYAAIWANDQAEYINPYFPFTGYAYGNASAMNAFRHFARYMNDTWKPIPSSIIAEGDGYWNGAGDRGDAAMIAYGAARYALASGSRDEASKLWPLIEWCLEFCRRKLNDKGVVASDSDELENRFPSGKANLCTSSLYYDALLSAAYLSESLYQPRHIARTYRDRAADLRQAIDRYFAARVEGFDTYAYYEGNDVLRSWICIPLTVGIHDRCHGTVEALFSPRLWTENGLLTQAGSSTFWDRSTLYALRGVFMAGETERAFEFLSRYSRTRLLGNHVPYAVEAWPEGGQRHLSAESALYGRIVTEGMFGIRPVGLRSFDLTPRLPRAWNYMNLKHVRAFGDDIDIRVERRKNKLQVTVSRAGKAVLTRSLAEGKTMRVELK